MTELTADRTAIRAPEREYRLEDHRRELTGYCYRMLGSTFEAEDAVQDTFVRAWRALDRFDGRSELRTWLYRIATNVCLDMLNGRKRRALPMDLAAPATADSILRAPLTESTWIEPIPDGRVLPAGGDPAELAMSRETVRLAFIAALQHLPPRQRAVLILRDVLSWSAREAAELLDTSVASVNSALQRARATLADGVLDAERPPEPMDDEHRELLTRYVEYFERFDVESLVSLLHEDATQTMPPYELWLRGATEIGRWLSGPGRGCAGSRLIAVHANGRQAFGQYRPSGPSGPGGPHEAFSLQVLEVSGGRIVGFDHFLDTARFFPLFGLPARLEE